MDKKTQKNLLALVKLNYAEIADSFSETRKHTFWPELARLAGEVKAEDKIFDVGCGNGRLLETLVSNQQKLNYLGVDQSEELINHARLQYPNNKFLVGDILELGEIQEINFDYVFCIAVLHHLPGADLRVAALRQLRNKVSNDGRIIVSVWDIWSQPKLKKLIYKFALLKIIKKNLPAGSLDFGDILFDWKKEEDGKLSRRYYHAFTKWGLKKIIKKAGLKIEKIYKADNNYYAILKK